MLGQPPKCAAELGGALLRPPPAARKWWPAASPARWPGSRQEGRKGFNTSCALDAEVMRPVLVSSSPPFFHPLPLPVALIKNNLISNVKVFYKIIKYMLKAFKKKVKFLKIP